jgi:hypothetical protein
MKNITIPTADSAIENPKSPAEKRRRQMLRSRATWWFQQMRRAVDSAVEWRPAPPARPEQGSLDLRRPTEVTVR